VSLSVVQMGLPHIEGAVGLQRDCFPAPFPEELLWQRAHLETHVNRFPCGQFVCLDGERVVGSASSTLVSEEVWLGHLSWEATVGGPFLETYDSEGTTLYGLDISVHPEYRGRGIGRMLYEERFRLVREGVGERYGTACRLPGYRDYATSRPGTSVEEYAEYVVKGLIQDRTLTPLLRYGLTYLGVIDDYMEDFESHNTAALLEWRP